MGSRGLIYRWGDYEHPPGEVYPHRVSVRSLKSPRGIRWGAEYRLELAGDLKGTSIEAFGSLSRSEIDTRIAELDAAYKYDYSDSVFLIDNGAGNPPTETSHKMLTNDAWNLTGNQVLYRSWDHQSPMEFANTRSFSIVIGATFLQTYSNIVEYRETVTKIGNGGPKWQKHELWNGAPLVEVLAASTKVRYIQQGSIVGINAYVPVPGPWWTSPYDHKGWMARISDATPLQHGHPSFGKPTHYQKTYAYYFELSSAQDQSPLPWPSSYSELNLG